VGEGGVGGGWAGGGGGGGGGGVDFVRGAKRLHSVLYNDLWKRCGDF